MGEFRGSSIMANTQYRIFVCTKKRPPDDPEGCCQNCGAIEVLNAFEQTIAAQQLGDRIKVKAAGCLDHCASGPVAMVFQPNRWELSWLPKKIQTKLQKKLANDRAFYGHLCPEDVPEFLNHLLDNKSDRRNSLIERIRL
jgi:(2Fe-2S) ferredoxin